MARQNGRHLCTSALFFAADRLTAERRPANPPNAALTTGQVCSPVFAMPAWAVGGAPENRPAVGLQAGGQTVSVVYLPEAVEPAGRRADGLEAVVGEDIGAGSPVQAVRVRPQTAILVAAVADAMRAATPTKVSFLVMAVTPPVAVAADAVADGQNDRR